MPSIIFESANFPGLPVAQLKMLNSNVSISIRLLGFPVGQTYSRPQENSGNDYSRIAARLFAEEDA